MSERKKPSRRDFEIAARELADVADWWGNNSEADIRREAPALDRVADWLAKGGSR